MPESVEVDAAAKRVEALLDGFAEPSTRERAHQLVRVLMELYGAGLSNILNIVRQGGDSEQWLLGRLADDRLVGSLLLIHGMHPIDTETRIRTALSRLERFLEGQRVILDGVADGTASVHVEADSGNRHSHVPAALVTAIEQAVRGAAPEVERVELEGIAHPSALVQIAMAHS